MDVEADIDQRLMEAEEMATMGLTCAPGRPLKPVLFHDPEKRSAAAKVCTHAHMESSKVARTHSHDSAYQALQRHLHAARLGCADDKEGISNWRDVI